MLGYILGTLFIVLAIWGFLSEHIPFFYNRIPKTAKENLRLDAKIIDFKQTGHSRKIGTYIETTVKFDDGFVYVSHNSKPTFFGVRTTQKINEEIVNEAYHAHVAAIEKYGCVNDVHKTNDEDNYIYYDENGNISHIPTSHKVRK